MNTIQRTTTAEETDALFDTRPHALAARFGRRTLQLLREGRDVRQAARIAASFAVRALPALTCRACQRVHDEPAKALVCCTTETVH